MTHLCASKSTFWLPPLELSLQNVVFAVRVCKKGSEIADEHRV
jgi:hypothetical protein